jgi:hypothetical protein
MAEETKDEDLTAPSEGVHWSDYAVFILPLIAIAISIFVLIANS